MVRGKKRSNLTPTGIRKEDVSTLVETEGARERTRRGLRRITQEPAVPYLKGVSDIGQDDVSM
jgi:hypothetical protein